MVKNLHAVWETWVLSLCWDDPLKKATSKQVFWPGEFHGQRSLAGSSPWGHKESDSTEQLTPSSLSVIPMVVGKTQLGRSQGSSRTQLLPVCSAVGWDLGPINTLISLSCSQISSWGLPLVKPNWKLYSKGT